MIEYILSLISGILTVLAPCSLPLLPIILASETDKRGRSIIIITSLSISIFIFTLLLKSTTLLIDIDQSTWELISGAIIILLGLLFIYPNLWERVSNRLKLGSLGANLVTKSNESSGYAKEILLGLALGPIFTSCSPTYTYIIATILPKDLLSGILLLLTYILGLALTLLLISKLGRGVVEKMKWIANPDGIFRKVFATVLILLGVLIATGILKDIETYLVSIDFLNTTKFELQIRKIFGY